MNSTGFLRNTGGTDCGQQELAPFNMGLWNQQEVLATNVSIELVREFEWFLTSCLCHTILQARHPRVECWSNALYI